RGNAVLDRILDQRANHQRRNPRVGERFGNVDLQPQPRAHADLEDGEKGARERDLLAEAAILPARARSGDTQALTQAAQQLATSFGLFLVEAFHARERVEQEVRLDLRLQQLQARLDPLALDVDPVELGAVQQALRTALPDG